jgi:hypothetical protein
VNIEQQLADLRQEREWARAALQEAYGSKSYQLGGQGVDRRWEGQSLDQIRAALASIDSQIAMLEAQAAGTGSVFYITGR